MTFRLTSTALAKTCDVNGDGRVDVTDVQDEINAVLGGAPCIADPDGDGRCTVVDVQVVIVAALGGACRLGP